LLYLLRSEIGTERALKHGIDVVDFPCHGQQTNDYAEFGARVREVPTNDPLGAGFS
jgi:hypothetical protein